MRGRTTARILTVMGTTAIALGLVTGGAMGASSKAKQYGKVAAKQCAKERKALGNEAFSDMYGDPAQPNCIGVVRPEVASESRNAAQECRAERKQDEDAFNNKYGKNKNKKNAFGKCVSGKVKSELSEDLETKVNAAQQCRAEQADPNFAAGHGGATFEQFYGTNPNDRNAFGKCVSSKAQAQQQS